MIVDVESREVELQRVGGSGFWIQGPSTCAGQREIKIEKDALSVEYKYVIMRPDAER